MTISLRRALLEAGAEADPTDPERYSMGSRTSTDRRKGQAWETRREHALEAMLHTLRSPWFLRAGVPGDFVAWPRRDANTLEVPPDLCAWALLESAGFDGGNWTLYAAVTPQPLAEGPATRRDLVAFRQWFAACSIDAAVLSGPANTEWSVFLKQEMSALPVVLHERGPASS